MNQTIRKIETILTSQYDVTNYTDFIREIFPTVQIVAPDRFHKEYTNFSSHIEGYAHVPSSGKIRRCVIFLIP